MNVTNPDDFNYLGENGEMAARLRAHPWESTSLGPPSGWSESLRVALSICIDSHFPMAVWWGPELVQFYNDAYRPILGALKHPSAFGGAARETWPDIWDTIGPMVSQVMAQGTAVKGDDMQLVLERNGYPETCYFTFSYSPIRDASGAVVGMFTAAVETTQRVLVERKLKENDRRKDEFLAMLAHELRNPLAPIGAAADLLSMVKLDEERVKRTSQIISRQVGHMTSLIDDLLDVSRVTRELVTLSLAAVSLNDIITDAVEQVRPLIESRKHRFTLQVGPAPATVPGDRKRLIQVVANILSNAAKYTPEGGNIALTTTVENEQVQITVTDDGIGMPPALVLQAFELFAQAERTSDRSQGGLGIGLALVRSLVELHEGKVSAHSTGAGAGSKFTVTLPLLHQAPVAQPGEESGSPQPPPKKRLRVVLVDDNVDAASMLGMFLEETGHEIIVEHLGRSALQRAIELVPDVCLLDIGLPDLDGNELARQMRELPGMANATLIAVTGYGQPKDLENTTSAGFNYHFVKPVDSNRLAALLHQLSLTA